MKYRNRNTNEVVTAIQATRSGMHEIPGGVMYLDEGDWMVTRADGSVEGYQSSHPFWSDHDEIVETRVVKIEDSGDVGFYVERLHPDGWKREAEKHLLIEIAETQAKVVAQRQVVKPKETIVSELEGVTVKAKPSLIDKALGFLGFGS